MVTTHLHYGLYLADILNNHSFLSCSCCTFSWTLSTIWDREKQNSFEHLHGHCLSSTLDREARFFLSNLYTGTVNMDRFIYSTTFGIQSLKSVMRRMLRYGWKISLRLIAPPRMMARAVSLGVSAGSISKR